MCWEAQFGDFANGAQIIIDQYLVAGEDKWQQCSGLVLLLPHGFEGQGPEHSSARMERFLILAAEDNIQVVNATTAAQYFHVLRRQLHRPVRRPLVVFTPKSLLRSPQARSAVEDLTTGGFHEVLDDPGAAHASGTETSGTHTGGTDASGLDPGAAEVVVVATGKIAHALIEARDGRGAPVAVVRVEQVFPFPGEALAETLARYPAARHLRWVQEEPANMGPWSFVKGRVFDALGDRFDIERVSRPESGSPATGSKTIHDQEHAWLLDQALRPAGS